MNDEGRAASRLDRTRVRDKRDSAGPMRYLRLVSAVVRARDASDVAVKLLPVLAKRGLAWPAARLVHRSIRPLTHKPGRYKVLIIEKAIFNDDALAALGDVDEIQVFGIGRAVLKAMAVALLPRHLCADDTYVADDPAARLGKARYRQFLRDMWLHLARLGGYDAVITGNWAYWAERELGAALEELGVPFIVLHKEGIKPPARSELLRHLFRKTRGQFMGRRMLVYHEDERHHQLLGDIARDDQIVIVGMPRMDSNHAWRRRAAAGEVPARAQRPLALFLAFLPNNFLPSYSGLDSDLAWNDLCRGSLRAMIRLAESDPGIHVVVRPRGQELPELKQLLDAAASSLGRPLPANLELSAEGDVTPLLKAAWVVCAHNTTVMFEGLAVGKPVIVPQFAEADDERYKGYIVEPGTAAELATSEDDLLARCLEHCRKPAPVQSELSAGAKAALAKWTGNAEGDSASRVRAAILRELSASDGSCGAHDQRGSTRSNFERQDRAR